MNHARLFIRKPQILALCFLGATSVVRTEPVFADAATPEEIAAQALAALREDRIDDFATMMHPDALASLKTALISVADAAEEQDSEDEFLAIFSDIETLDELRKLDDAAFFTAFLEGMIQMMPQMRDALRGMTLTVIGHVPEGDDIVHVVYRGSVTQGEVTISKMAVMSLKSHGTEWRLLLTGDVESMAVWLKGQFKVKD